MARRSTTYKKLKKQPLSLVLSEFRFNPILKIADKIPDIQESLRDQYPHFNKLVESRLVLFTKSTGEDVPPPQTTERWLFTNARKNKAIQIDHERLIFFSADYARFPTFRANCVEVLKVLQQHVNPNLLLRVGLRYNDVVVPCDNEKLSDYLDLSMIPPNSIEGIQATEFDQRRTETIWRTSAGNLAIRTYISKQGLSVMPDLNISLPIQVRDDCPDDIVTAVLDFDHFWQATHGEVKFSISNAQKYLSNLHEIAREAFWKVTTKFAMDKWA